MPPPASQKKRTWSAAIFSGFNLGYGAVPSRSLTSDGSPVESSGGSTRNTLAFAVSAETPIATGLYIEPTLAYVQRGVRYNIATIESLNLPAEVILNYIELPLLLKAKLATHSPRLRFCFSLGPAIGVLVTRKAEVLGLVEKDLTERFEGHDAMLHLGGGIEYALNRDSALLSHVRYNLGLIDIDKEESYFYSRGIQILFGFQFGL